MTKTHHYRVTVQWIGNTGSGTSGYGTCARDHEISSDAGIVVNAYTDRAEGFMEESASDSGRFQRVVLRPSVTVAAGADAAHALCFIANSVNFPVEHEPEIIAG